MKHLLTSFLILTSMVGAGQTNGLIMDTTGLQKGTITAGKGIIIVRDTGSMITIIADSTYKPDTGYYLLPAEKDVYDTIPVMMMVCDTNRFAKLEKIRDTIWWEEGGAIVSHGLAQVYKYDDRVYWINGYEVREAYRYWGGPDTKPGQMMVYAVAVLRTGYNHVKYLDSAKHPLKPEIIVWNHKNRKK